MESSSNECVFQTVLESSSIQKQLAPTCITEKQSQKIIACSKERKDNLYKDFEKDSVTKIVIQLILLKKRLQST